MKFISGKLRRSLDHPTTEILKQNLYSDGKHCALLACSYIKIALSKVGHNFLTKDFIFLQGRSQVKQTYWTGLQKNNHN